MPDSRNMALIKEIADQIEASSELCRAANFKDIYVAEAVARSRVSIARSRSQIARIDGTRTARWPVMEKRTNC